MHTRHDAIVCAPPDVIFSLAADVERWPTLHRAYRSCRVLERAPDRLVFEMAGCVRGWPARWTAVQERDPARRLVFRHSKGLTTGMRVEWVLTPHPSGTAITLVHDLVVRWPLIGRPVMDLVVGPFFIDWIARQTLLAIQQAAERAQRR
jgi:ribosome-associated toxin RatA of RatAB toxin-antitoxin module